MIETIARATADGPTAAQESLQDPRVASSNVPCTDAQRDELGLAKPMRPGPEERTVHVLVIIVQEPLVVRT